ncbi:hypothetical protein F5Y14DRAFT_28935 [Nemania sp. NC0429]|nr:hypothetical protein F5Y14DRAFT_28935 [Nemania sp. NC0429]
MFFFSGEVFLFLSSLAPAAAVTTSHSPRPTPAACGYYIACSCSSTCGPGYHRIFSGRKAAYHIPDPRLYWMVSRWRETTAYIHPWPRLRNRIRLKRNRKRNRKRNNSPPRSPSPSTKQPPENDHSLHRLPRLLHHHVLLRQNLRHMLLKQSHSSHSPSPSSITTSDGLPLESDQQPPSAAAAIQAHSPAAKPPCYLHHSHQYRMVYYWIATTTAYIYPLPQLLGHITYSLLKRHCKL